MKYRIGAVLLLSLMLSMLFMPLAVSADDSKSIIKEMVQSPQEYGVGVLDPIFLKYGIWDIDRHWSIPGYYNMADRYWQYMPSRVFIRLSPYFFS